MAELKRELSFFTILIITVNSIMGTGIFFLPAIGARNAGAASILSWLLISVIAFCFSLIFAELCGLYPKSGGIYEYTKQAFGPFPSFIFGWLALVGGNLTIAMLIVGAVRYLNPALPESLKIIISIVFVCIFNYIAYRGLKTSAVMLTAFGFVTLATLLALIIPGFPSFTLDNLTPFFTSSFSVVLLTTFLIAETFFGWETTTFLAEEVKDPKKIMPRALWLGTLIMIGISLLLVIVTLANVPAAQFGAAAAPLSYLATIYYGSGADKIVSLFVYLSIIGSVAGWIVSAPRLVMSLAKDKLFLTQTAEIHPTYNTPYKAIIFQTIITSFLIIVASGSYELLLELLLPLILTMYFGVVLAFFVLRNKEPAKRPFKVWMGKPIAIILMLAIIGLVAAWLITGHDATRVLWLALSFIGAGIPLYLLLMFYYDPDSIIKVTEALSVFSLLLEGLLLPKSVRTEIITIFKHLQGKRILEYGAGVGTLTLQLAHAVGPRGSIIATDIGKRNLKILNRRLDKEGIRHVTTLHDPHQVNRVHPQIEEVDMVYSVGMLSYVQDLDKVLGDLRRVLEEKGKVCFVEYVDFFHLLPNPGWLNDFETLKKNFRKRGYGVQVVKINGLLWNYLFIYGEKVNEDVVKVPYI